MTSSCQNNERNHLQEIEVRQPIAGCIIKDEHWSQHDNAVYSKLHTENTITERQHFLEKTIYDEALKLFSHKSLQYKIWPLSLAGPNTALSLLYKKTTFRHKSLQQLSLKNKPVFIVLQTQSKETFDHNAGERSTVKSSSSTRKTRSCFIKILIRLEKIYFNQRHLYCCPQVSQNWMLISLIVLKVTSTTFFKFSPRIA